MAMKPQYPELLAVLRELVRSVDADPREPAIANPVAKARHLVAEFDACGESLPEGSINMASGVNQHGQPFVKYEWTGEFHRTQFKVAEARQHALALLETAEAAEMDSCVYRHAVEAIGLEPEKAAQLVAQMRNFRVGQKDKSPHA